MPSWVAALMEVPEEWIAHLGGWAISGTAARYVGTVERRIKTMQATVAAKLRETRNDSDVIDEDGLLFSLGKYLLDLGYDKEEAESQLGRLNWFAGEQSLPDEAEVRDIEFDDGFGEVTAKEGDLAPTVETVIENGEDEDLDVIKEEFSLPAVRESMRKSLPPDLLGKFAISVGIKSERRCLHLLLATESPAYITKSLEFWMNGHRMIAIMCTAANAGNQRLVGSPKASRMDRLRRIVNPER